MLFGGRHDWYSKNSGDKGASYNALAKLRDPIIQAFHEKLCKRITEDRGYYLVILLGKHTWVGSRHWLPKENFLNRAMI